MERNEKRAAAANLSAGYLMECLKTAIRNQTDDYLGEEARANAKETEEIITEELMKRLSK